MEKNERKLGQKTESRARFAFHGKRRGHKTHNVKVTASKADTDQRKTPREAESSPGPVVLEGGLVRRVGNWKLFSYEIPSRDSLFVSTFSFVVGFKFLTFPPQFSSP